VKLVLAAGRTNEETMNGVKALAPSRYDPPRSEMHHSSTSNVQGSNKRARNLIVLELALEVAFLAILATYELSSIFRFQN
jgi:hypothetical protein